MKVGIERVSAPLRAAFEAAHGRLITRELLLLVLEDNRGCIGLGEAAPLESYDGVSLAQVQAALEDCRSSLSAADGTDRLALLAECRQRAVLPQAVAAIDLALWDLAGRRAGEPVWRLLGARATEPVAVNHTLAASDRAGAAQEAAQARAAGFQCLKAKVAIGDDAGRLAAVRAAAGREVALRIDANGAWSEAEARAALQALEPLGIELCEEPVGSLEQLAGLTGRTPVALALDESVSLPGALERRLATAVSLKLSRCGGITGLIDTATQARRVGYEVYLSSTFDGPLGIAGALHAALAIAPERPCGLATLSLFADREDPLPPLRGAMYPPTGPGLGDGLRRWYR